MIACFGLSPFRDYRQASIYEVLERNVGIVTCAVKHQACLLSARIKRVGCGYIPEV